MNNTWRLFVLCACLLFAWSVAQAGIAPISVLPDPAQFGTVPQYSASYLTLYVSSSTSASVTVTGMTISGTNSGDFAFNGPYCLGTLAPGQTCLMSMLFTPATMGNLTANLLISVEGLKKPIAIPLQGIGGSPLPVITSLSPPSVYVNSPAFTLTVTGSGFLLGAVVYLDNVALPTTYVSATQLTASVAASYLTGTGADYVVVANPPPGGGSSGSTYLYVVALDPNLSTVSPNTVVAATTPTPLILSGGNFMNGATVLWNGRTLPTTYLSSSQLQVQPTVAEFATPSIVQLSVSNPPPGGVSTPITFNVTYPAKVAVLDLPANDLVWDPYAQRIYASLPSSYGSQGNSIAVINPATAQVTGYHFAGSEPNTLALSTDSKYLYAGLNGNGSVQRLVLPTLARDIDVSLGSVFGSLNTALSMQVFPGDSHSFAVAEGTSGCCGGSGLFFYTDATQLPNSITSYPPITDVVFGNATTLYGYNNGTLSQVAVNSSGGTLSNQWNTLGNSNSIEYAAGLVYGNGGEVFNPQTGLLVGSFEVSSSYCCAVDQLLPDAPINRVFALGQTPFFNGLGITSYNRSKFTPLAVANLTQLNGTATSGFIPWGSNGVAFIVQSGCCGSVSNQVVLVQSPTMLLTAGGGPYPVPVAQSLSPASATHGGWNFPLLVKGTGFVPGSQVTWNGTALAVSYMSPTQLKVYVPAPDILSAGTANVVVKNPTPGGGSSTALVFTIN